VKRHPSTIRPAFTSAVLLFASAAVVCGFEWEKLDFQNAVAKTQAENRILYVLFGEKDCGYCKRLETEVLAEATVVDELRDLVAIKIHINSDEGASLSREYGVWTYPTTILLNSDIEEIDRIVGYVDVDKYVTRLRDYIAGRNTMSDCISRLQKNPLDPLLNFQLAEKYIDRRLYATAYIYLDQAIEFDPHNHSEIVDDALFMKGLHLHTKNKRTDRAIPVLQRVVADFPKSDKAVFAFVWLVRCNGAVNDREAIINAYETYVRKLPVDPRPHRAIVDVLMSHWGADGDAHKVALAAAHKAVKLDPGDRSHYSLAVVLKNMGDTDNAREAADTARRLNPKDPRYWQLRTELEKGVTNE